MTQPEEPLPTFLAEPSKIGQEISVTGKWIPTKQGGLFRKSAESKEMLKEWGDIHAGAKGDAGVLSTEINHALGEDAVLVHHVFMDPDALVHYFSTTATTAHGRAHQDRQASVTPHSWSQHPRSCEGSAICVERAWGVWRIPFWIREGGLQAPRPRDRHQGHRQVDVQTGGGNSAQRSQVLVAATWY